MSSSLTGYSANNPRAYLGPNISIVNAVSRSRAPTGADYRQPETGKLYPFSTVWVVGKNPTTGVYGDLWILSKIESNVAFWVQVLNSGSLINGGNILGNTSGLPVASGYLGEYISSFIPFNGAVSTLTTDVVSNVTSIVLTPGTWDVSGIVMFTSITTGTYQVGSVSPAVGGIANNSYGDSTISSAFTASGPSDIGLSIPAVRVNAVAPTTYYLKAQAAFTAGAAKAYGRISATRVR